MCLVRSPDGHPDLSSAQVFLAPAGDLGPSCPAFLEVPGLFLCLSLKPMGGLVWGQSGRIQQPQAAVHPRHLPLLQADPTTTTTTPGLLSEPWGSSKLVVLF